MSELICIESKRFFIKKIENAKFGKSSKIDNNGMEMMYEIAKVLPYQNRLVWGLRVCIKKFGRFKVI